MVDILLSVLIADLHEENYFYRKKKKRKQVASWVNACLSVVLLTNSFPSYETNF